MKLVEVVRSVVTEPEVLDDVEAFAQQLGKVDVTIGDRAGFIANALLFGYLNHAAAMYESHYASREDIDAAMKLGCGLPMGPLSLLDLIGLDTAYEILDTMYRQRRDRLHAPTPIFKQMITAGLLGRKSGRGFYTYDAAGLAERRRRRADAGSRRRDRRRPRRCRPGRRGRLRDDGDRHHRGVRQGGLRRDIPSRAAPRRSPRSSLRSPARWRRRCSAASSPRPTATPRWAGSPARRASTTSPTYNSWSRPSSRSSAVKQALFTNLDDICAPGTVLATTTSSLPVIECAAATSRPADVIGMHFFNPATIMRLVEVVTTVSTAADVEATVLDVTRKIGKHAVRCGDRAGFIVNALLFPYLNDAVKMLEAHYATRRRHRLGDEGRLRLPDGPVRAAGRRRQRRALAIERELYLEFREPGYAPAPLLEQLVTAGRLGRKTGKGFRDFG